MSNIPKPRFNLRSPKSKNETIIFLVFRYRGKRLLYSTGLNILPSEWDFDSQRPIEKENRPDLWSIRRRLDEIANQCKTIYIESDYGAISLRNFKSQLNQNSKSVELILPYREITLLEFLDIELSEMKRLGMLNNSFRSYKLQVNNIKKFAKSKGRFDFEDVDWNFRLEFIDWLSQRNIQLGYGNKTLSVLRQFMERARRKGYHSNTRYQGNGWKVTRKKASSQKVILSPIELQELAQLPLKGLHKKARDLFLIGAGTGQRFSDYTQYIPEQFYKTMDGVPLLSVISQKTAIPAKIPLNLFPWLLPILEEYQYQSPPLSLQKLNVGIKEVCRKAGMEEKVLKVEQYMGRKARIEKSYVPKWQEISSHTCRRSFATNLYRMGYRLSQIMPMTGHTTEAQLREYIGIDAEENALEIARTFQKRQNNNF